MAIEEGREPSEAGINAGMDTDGGEGDGDDDGVDGSDGSGACGGALGASASTAVLLLSLRVELRAPLYSVSVIVSDDMLAESS